MFDVPYGLSYFPTIRRDGLVFVDKSRYIRDLETGARAFCVFLRPRRFGKSTLLSMLEHYYEKKQAQHFDALFGGLDIGRAPTPRRNSYRTLRLEFTGVNTDGTLEDCMRSVYNNLCVVVNSFCVALPAVPLQRPARLLPFTLHTRSPSDDPLCFQATATALAQVAGRAKPDGSRAAYNDRRGCRDRPAARERAAAKGPVVL